MSANVVRLSRYAGKSIATLGMIERHLESVAVTLNERAVNAGKGA